MKKIMLSAIVFMALVSCQEKLLVNGDYPIEPITKSSEEPSDGKDPAISKWDALKIVEPITNKYPDRWVDISEKVIPAGTALIYNPTGMKMERDSVSTFTSPDFDAWLAVVEHDGRYAEDQEQLHIFINSLTGEYSEVQLDGRIVVDWDTSRNIYVDNGSDITNLLQRELPRTRSSSPTQWAVIISGGYQTVNYDCFWNDCQYAYNMLTQELNYPANHIFCLVSDGLSAGYDRRIGPNSFDNSPVDFDNDGYIDVYNSAIEENIEAVFSYLGGVVSEGDEVLIYITGYGWVNGSLYLWDGELMTASELDGYIDMLGSSVTIDVVMGYISSGSSLPTLKADNRAILSATGELAYPGISQQYGGYTYFLRYWADAVYNIDPTVLGTYSNGDGFLSCSEMFKYACSHPCVALGFDTPTRSSDIICWGHDLTGNKFIPVILGSDYASTNNITSYTYQGIPAASSCTWSCSSNLRIYSSNNSSASITGNNLLPSQFVSLGASLTLTFSDLGETWDVSKEISSVWKPGPYMGYNYIVRNNKNYYLTDYPTVGTYPGTSNYQWFSNSSSWNIVSQDGAYVTVQNVPSGSINVSVVFEDPFGGTIYISDQVS